MSPYRAVALRLGPPTAPWWRRALAPWIGWELERRRERHGLTRKQEQLFRIIDREAGKIEESMAMLAGRYTPGTPMERAMLALGEMPSVPSRRRPWCARGTRPRAKSPDTLVDAFRRSCPVDGPSEPS